MRVQMSVAALAAVLAVSGCEDPKNRAGVAEAIRDADLAFAKATAKRGVEGWVSYFADSGVMVIPGRNVVGRTAIREVMAAELGDTTASLTWRPASVEVSSGDDMGFTIGRWNRTSRVTAGAPVLHGSYVTIWRKQGDGTWKVVLDIGTADPPAD